MDMDVTATSDASSEGSGMVVVRADEAESAEGKGEEQPTPTTPDAAHQAWEVVDSEERGGKSAEVEGDRRDLGAAAGRQNPSSVPAPEGEGARTPPLQQIGDDDAAAANVSNPLRPLSPAWISTGNAPSEATNRAKASPASPDVARKAQGAAKAKATVTESPTSVMQGADPSCQVDDPLRNPPTPVSTLDEGMTYLEKAGGNEKPVTAGHGGGEGAGHQVVGTGAPNAEGLAGPEIADIDDVEAAMRDDGERVSRRGSGRGSRRGSHRGSRPGDAATVQGGLHGSSPAPGKDHRGSSPSACSEKENDFPGYPTLTGHPHDPVSAGGQAGYAGYQSQEEAKPASTEDPPTPATGIAGYLQGVAIHTTAQVMSTFMPKTAKVRLYVSAMPHWASVEVWVKQSTGTLKTAALRRQNWTKQDFDSTPATMKGVLFSAEVHVGVSDVLEPVSFEIQAFTRKGKLWTFHSNPLHLPEKIDLFITVPFTGGNQSGQQSAHATKSLRRAFFLTLCRKSLHQHLKTVTETDGFEFVRQKMDEVIQTQQMIDANVNYHASSTTYEAALAGALLDFVAKVSTKTWLQNSKWIVLWAAVLAYRSSEFAPTEDSQLCQHNDAQKCLLQVLSEWSASQGVIAKFRIDDVYGAVNLLLASRTARHRMLGPFANRKNWQKAILNTLLHCGRPILGDLRIQDWRELQYLCSPLEPEEVSRLVARVDQSRPPLGVFPEMLQVAMGLSSRGRSLPNGCQLGTLLLVAISRSEADHMAKTAVAVSLVDIVVQRLKMLFEGWARHDEFLQRDVLEFVSISISVLGNEDYLVAPLADLWQIVVSRERARYGINLSMSELKNFPEPGLQRVMATAMTTTVPPAQRFDFTTALDYLDFCGRVEGVLQPSTRSALVDMSEALCCQQSAKWAHRCVLVLSRLDRAKAVELSGQILERLALVPSWFREDSQHDVFDAISQLCSCLDGGEEGYQFCECTASRSFTQMHLHRVLSLVVKTEDFSRAFPLQASRWLEGRLQPLCKEALIRAFLCVLGAHALESFSLETECLASAEHKDCLEDDPHREPQTEDLLPHDLSIPWTAIVGNVADFAFLAMVTTPESDRFFWIPFDRALQDFHGVVHQLTVGQCMDHLEKWQCFSEKAVQRLSRTRHATEDKVTLRALVPDAQDATPSDKSLRQTIEEYLRRAQALKTAKHVIEVCLPRLLPKLNLGAALAAYLKDKLLDLLGLPRDVAGEGAVFPVTANSESGGERLGGGQAPTSLRAIKIKDLDTEEAFKYNDEFIGNVGEFLARAASVVEEVDNDVSAKTLARVWADAVEAASEGVEGHGESKSTEEEETRQHFIRAAELWQRTLSSVAESMSSLLHLRAGSITRKTLREVLSYFASSRVEDIEEVTERWHKLLRVLSDEDGETKGAAGEQHSPGRMIRTIIEAQKVSQVALAIEKVLRGLFDGDGQEQRLREGVHQHFWTVLRHFQVFATAAQQNEEGDDEDVVIDELVFRSIADGVQLLEQRLPRWQTLHALLDGLSKETGVSMVLQLWSKEREGARLTSHLMELADGALTAEKLNNIDLLQGWLQPIFIAARALQQKTEVEPRWTKNDWPHDFKRRVQKTTFFSGLMDVAFETLSLLESLPTEERTQTMDALGSALRLGRLVQQNLRESENNAAAVRNAVRGLLRSEDGTDNKYGRLVFTKEDNKFQLYGIYGPPTQEKTLTENELTECADKAALAVPGSESSAGVDTDARAEVELFCKCVERAIGVRQQLNRLLLTGNPQMYHTTSSFPATPGGLSPETSIQLWNEFTRLQKVNADWTSAITDIRRQSALIARVPSVAIWPLRGALLAGDKAAIQRRLSSVCWLESFEQDEGERIRSRYDVTRLEELGQACAVRDADRTNFDAFLLYVDYALSKIMDGGNMCQYGSLHQKLVEDMRNRSILFPNEDGWDQASKAQAAEAKVTPNRLLIVREKPHAGRPDESVALRTALSILLPEGDAPSHESLLACDERTSADDVERFLELQVHRTMQRSPSNYQPIGVLAQVNRLAVEAFQALLKRFPECRKEAASRYSTMLRVAVTVTNDASSERMDLLRQHGEVASIYIIKRTRLEDLLKRAAAYLPQIEIVRSNQAGDGKSHYIKTKCNSDCSSAVWGGAQTRSSAAGALLAMSEAGVSTARLELFPFDVAGSLEADLMLGELLLSGCVFDSENACWVRLPSHMKIYLEVCNSLVVGRLGTFLDLKMPLLALMPERHEVDGGKPFDFSHPFFPGDDVRRSFSIAGTALVMDALRQAHPEEPIVGQEGSGIFQLVGGTKIRAMDGESLLADPDRLREIVQSAQIRLTAAMETHNAQGMNRNCSKATIVTYLRFLARWVENWAHQLILYGLQLAERGENHALQQQVEEPFVEILRDMCAMAAKVCVRSSAGAAQNVELVRNRGRRDVHRAMADRVRDQAGMRDVAWAFNAGGAIMICADAGEVPDVIRRVRKLWSDMRRDRDQFAQIPESLDGAGNQTLQDLLLQTVRGNREVDTREREALFENYALTKDNMIKIIDAVERLRAGLPVMMIGEAGCGKTELMRRAARLMGLHEEHMLELPVHAGTSLDDLADIVDAAAESLEGDETGTRLVFLDELNTCPHGPALKRLFVDRLHPKTNLPLHGQIRLAAACNPYRSSPDPVVEVGFKVPETTRQRDYFYGLCYRVYPLPESLFNHLTSFGELSAEAEKTYIKRMMQGTSKVLTPWNSIELMKQLPAHVLDAATSAVNAAHEFFRQHNLHVSLRDPVRLAKLWAHGRHEMNTRTMRFESVNALNEDLTALVVALHLVYETRLPDLRMRAELVTCMIRGKLGSVLRSAVARTFTFGFTKSSEAIWNDAVMSEEEYWTNCLEIPSNVAPVRALRENVHCAIVCFMTRTPLFIVGKPGCSKSLTISLLLTALSDPRGALTNVARAVVSPFQGSRQSKSEALLTVFKQAKERQRQFQAQQSLQEQLQGHPHPTLSLVLLDEVGLAEQSPENPLKVLHAQLEPRDPEDAVATIAISNWELDRSKMNRGLSLACPAAEAEDLKTIGTKIIRFYLEDRDIRRRLEECMKHLAEAFLEHLRCQSPKDFHGLRDWYGTCSYAARLLLAADRISKVFTKELQGNARDMHLSDGLNREGDFLVKLCQEHNADGRSRSVVPVEWAVHLALLNNMGGNRGFTAEEDGDSLQKLCKAIYTSSSPRPLDEVAERIARPTRLLETLLGDVDGRHVMVICRCAGPVIRWIEATARHAARWQPETLIGSALERDQSGSDMYAQSMLQAAIVSMAQERRLLILQNLAVIHTALYDLFNANYSRGGGSGGQRFCRVARANFCNPRCAVADQFKAVLVVPPEQARRFEPALLNRFAKVEVELCDLLDAFDGRHLQAWRAQVQQSMPCLGAQPGEDDEVMLHMPAAPPGLLHMVELSLFTQHPELDDYTGEEQCRLANELLLPMLAPESNLENQQRSGLIQNVEGAADHLIRPHWTFPGLIRAVVSHAEFRGGLLPVIVPTYCCDMQPQILKELHSATGLRSIVEESIAMTLVPSHVRLHEKLDAFVSRSIDAMDDDEDALCCLHVHIDMRNPRAKDGADYFIAQLDKVAKHISKNRPLGRGYCVLALVVASRRSNSSSEARLRPFVLSKPSVDDAFCEAWRCVYVDCFSSNLPWNLSVEELLHGSRADCLGLGTEVSPDRLCSVLRDLFPYAIAKISSQGPALARLEAFAEAATSHDLLLVDVIGQVLSNGLTAEGDEDDADDEGWRLGVASNASLLQKTGSLLLALLSSLRSEETVVPVIEKVLLQGLHESCGNMLIPREVWRSLAVDLLSRPERPLPLSAQLNGQPLACPGAPAILRVILPCAATGLLYANENSESTKTMTSLIAACRQRMAAKWLALEPDLARLVTSHPQAAAQLAKRDAVSEATSTVCRGIERAYIVTHDVKDFVRETAEMLTRWLADHLWSVTSSAPLGGVGGGTGEYKGDAAKAMDTSPERALEEQLEQLCGDIAVTALAVPVTREASLLMLRCLRVVQEEIPGILSGGLQAQALTGAAQIIIGRTPSLFTRERNVTALLKASLERLMPRGMPLLPFSFSEIRTRVAEAVSCTIVDLCKESSAFVDAEMDERLRMSMRLATILHGSYNANAEVASFLVLGRMMISEEARAADVLARLVQYMLHPQDRSSSCLSRAVTTLEDFTIPLEVALIGIQRAMDLATTGQDDDGPAAFAAILQLAARRLGESFDAAARHYPYLGALVTRLFLRLMISQKHSLQKLAAFCSGNFGTPQATSILSSLNAVLQQPSCKDSPMIAILSQCIARVCRMRDLLRREVDNLAREQTQLKAYENLVEFLEHLNRCLARWRNGPASVTRLICLTAAKEATIVAVDLVQLLRTTRLPYEDKRTNLRRLVRDLLRTEFSQSARAPMQIVPHYRETRLPPPLCSLFAVAAMRRPGAELNGKEIVRWLNELFSEDESDAGRWITSCLGSIESGNGGGNGLGFRLVSLRATSFEQREEILGDLAVLDEEDEVAALSARLTQRFANYHERVRYCSELAEAAGMQRSDGRRQHVDQAVRLQNSLLNQRVRAALRPLGPAAMLLQQIGEPLPHPEPLQPFSVSGDLAPTAPEMVPAELWRSSFMLHLLAAFSPGVAGATPPSLTPFVKAIQVDQGALSDEFWPGLPDNEWDMWIRSGQRKGISLRNNLGVYQCECGYRYMLSECLGPAEMRRCYNADNPDIACSNQNGGQGHALAPNQSFLGAVRLCSYAWNGFGRFVPDLTVPKAGLFALMEAETARDPTLRSRLRRGTRENRPAQMCTDSDSGITFRGLAPVAFRLLHLFVHGALLLGVAADPGKLAPLQRHLRDVASMRVVADDESVYWFLDACVRADIAALHTILNRSAEDVMLFIHAALHRLVECAAEAPTDLGELRSQEQRINFERWFERQVVQPILPGAQFDGVQAMRTSAENAATNPEPARLKLVELLCRSAPIDWERISVAARQRLLPHVLNFSPSPRLAMLEAQVQSLSFVPSVLRLFCATVQESHNGRDVPIVSGSFKDALMIGNILPFLRWFRQLHGGRLHQRSARRTSFASFFSDLPEEEQEHGRSLFEMYKDAWNEALGANIQNGCRNVQVPRIREELPVAFACPLWDAAPPAVGDIPVGFDHPPEKLAALGLHELALQHNLLLWQIRDYLARNGAELHVQLHASANSIEPSGRCISAEAVGILKAGAEELLSDRPPSMEALLTKVEQTLLGSYQPCFDISGDLVGTFNVREAEARLALWFFSGRRPFRMNNPDHMDLEEDIDEFPYHLDYSSISIAMLSQPALVDRKDIARQVPLRVALGDKRAFDQLERSLFHDPARAKQIRKLTGDLITMLRCIQDLGSTRESMTLKGFACLCDEAGRSLSERPETAIVHPDALANIEKIPEIETIPLCGLVSLYLLATEHVCFADFRVENRVVLTTEEGFPVEDLEDLPAGYQLPEGAQHLDPLTRLLARYVALSPPRPHVLRPAQETDRARVPLFYMLEHLNLVSDLALPEDLPIDAYDPRIQQISEAGVANLAGFVPASLHAWDAYTNGHAARLLERCLTEWHQDEHCGASARLSMASEEESGVDQSSRDFETQAATVATAPSLNVWDRYQGGIPPVATDDEGESLNDWQSDSMFGVGF